MKNILVILFLVSIYTVEAQGIVIKEGPIIKKFGKVYQIDNPDLVLKTDVKYKVIFDIYTDRSKDTTKNPLLNTVARFLNMHAQQGVLLENMEIAVILHGSATKNVLSNLAYQNHFNTTNPNSQLVQELKKANVDLYVCGQSFIANGFKLEEKSSDIKLSLSALTALVEFQRNGFQIINFN
jgi:intracellular sulfur oxidation DsrE/DsrF family protein